jgi:hypothetical protein
VNRWKLPMAVAALLAGPAVLLGWNATALAATLTEPWTTAAGAPVRSPGPQEAAPAGEVSPVPAAVPTATSQPPAPARTVVVVHKTVHSSVGGQSTQEDDVSTSDERGTDSGPVPHPDAGPVPVTDPTLEGEDPGQAMPDDPATGQEDLPDDDEADVPPPSNQPPTTPAPRP